MSSNDSTGATVTGLPAASSSTTTFSRFRSSATCAVVSASTLEEGCHVACAGEVASGERLLVP